MDKSEEAAQQLLHFASETNMLNFHFLYVHESSGYSPTH